MHLKGFESVTIQNEDDVINSLNYVLIEGEMIRIIVLSVGN